MSITGAVALAGTLMFVLVPAASLAQVQPGNTAPALTLDDAISLGKKHNPGLQSQRNDANASEWSLKSAYSDFLPTLNASNTFGYIAPGERRAGSVVLGEQPSIHSSSYAVGLSYSVSGARFVQPAIASAELAASRGRTAAAEAQLASEVTRSYLAALQSRQLVLQTEREVARTRDHAVLARARAAAGAVSPLDVTRAEVQVAQAELKRLRAANQADVDVLSLSRAIGVLLPLTTRLTSEFALIEPNWNADSLIALALQRGGTIEGARAQQRAAQARLRSARLGHLPSLTFSVNYNGWVQRAGSFEDAVKQRVGTATDTASIARAREQLRSERAGFPFNYNKQPISASVTVSVPVFQGLSRFAQVQSSRASAQDASHQLAAERLRLEVEVTSAILSLRGAYQAALLQRVVREKAAEESRLALDRFRAGMAGPLAVTDAHVQLAQAELDEIQAVYDFHKQLAGLETLIAGRLR